MKKSVVENMEFWVAKDQSFISSFVQKVKFLGFLVFGKSWNSYLDDKISNNWVRSLKFDVDETCIPLKPYMLSIDLSGSNFAFFADDKLLVGQEPPPPPAPHPHRSTRNTDAQGG